MARRVTSSQVFEIAAGWMSGPFIWGTRDCCTSACDVFQDLFGIDPMSEIRGIYSSQASALTLIQSRGGWLKMTRGFAKDHGLVPMTGRSAPGDIGLAITPGGFALAIGTGTGWLAKGDPGIVAGDFALRGVWRVNQ